MWVLKTPDDSVEIRWSDKRPSWLHRWFWKKFANCDFIKVEGATWGIMIRGRENPMGEDLFSPNNTRPPERIDVENVNITITVDKK